KLDNKYYLRTTTHQASPSAPSEENTTTAGKTLAALAKFVDQSSQQDTGTKHVNTAMEDFLSSSVTLTPEREYEDESGENFRTRLASDRYVVLTSSSEAENTDVYASVKVNSPVPYVQTQTEAIASSRLSDAEFLDRLNVNSAKHACILSELRLRCEYEITVRERFEKKFMKSYETIQQKDAEIVSLKARMQRAEGEATEVIRLHGQVSKLETMAVMRVK
ncbi:hypothetical protein Tco_0069261, partial [Tanacetum coccineum]